MMDFHATDARMRELETARDGSIPNNAYILARLDGRGFSRLTNDRFEKPFDVRFYRMMQETVHHMMTQSGCSIVFGFSQSDEMSLLMLPYCMDHGRKARKLLSLLAAEASAKFSLLLGEMATFDCRLNLQYDAAGVRDYFLWRSVDAGRNALNAYCYWLLRREGMEAQAAADFLRPLDAQARRQLLEKRGITRHMLPAWQLSGTCYYWQEQERSGFNPHTGETTRYTRRVLSENEELNAGLSALDAALAGHSCSTAQS